MVIPSMELNFCLVTILTINFFHLTYEEHKCGRPIGSEFRLEEDRVVAGYDIGYYRYPWYVALMRYNLVSCGAALIGPKTVITAAHCFKEFLNLANKGLTKLEEVYTIKLGAYNICTTEKSVRDYKAEKVIIHELYYKKKPYYDISLIILSGDTTAYIPICLPPPSMKTKPLDGTVPGLGTLRYHGAMPCTVHEVRLLIQNDTECFNMINSTGNDPYLIHNAFCAGYIQGGIDTCQGDSGGPLQAMNQYGDYILIGIVSYGFRCADPGLLGMYTDVSKYLDWIREKSGLKPEIVLPPISNNFEINGNSSGVKPQAQGGNQIVITNGPNHHRRVIHLTRPYRRPIKVIIYKNKQWHVTTKSLLHHPIVRTQKHQIT